MSYSIFLLRHGPSALPAGLYGKSDIIVPDEIHHKIKQSIIKKQLNLSHVMTSPLSRCLDLAKLIQSSDPRMSIESEALLQEMDFGDFDGCSFDELQPHWQVVEKLWTSPSDHQLPNAESLSDFYSRVKQAWQMITRKYQKNTLVVCHGGTIRMLLCLILQIDWQLPTIYSRLQIGHGSLTEIKVFGDDSSHYQVSVIGESTL